MYGTRLLVRRASAAAVIIRRPAKLASAPLQRLSTSAGGGSGVPKSMRTAAIRDSWRRYWTGADHAWVDSSSLLPENRAADPSLLFVNSGMVQFKDMFTGVEPADSRPYSRCATMQRCVRAGGKHNDLDQVGVTARHHTFFEMAGNFSWHKQNARDVRQMKEQAIVHAWQYLTRTLALPTQRLSVSVFERDDESAALWRAVAGFDDSRIRRLGKSDNYWSMGDGPGPSGPCTEIFWDQLAPVDGERLLEIWNLVFMEIEQSTGKKLAVPCVDTGMGLERIASVMQSVPTNYDIDSNQTIMRAIHALIRDRLAAASTTAAASTSALPRDTVLRGLDSYANGLDRTPVGVATRVILDHARAVTMLIADGVTPSNTGAGYVLRRIIRRAVRYGTQLGINDPFLYTLVPTVAASFEGAYPHVDSERQRVIESVVRSEEANFHQTLHTGERVLNTHFARLARQSDKQSDATATAAPTAAPSAAPKPKLLPGETAFLLYDSYSFPVDLTALISRERGYDGVDMQTFDRLMAAQRERSVATGTSNSSAGMGGRRAAASTAPAAAAAAVAAPPAPITAVELNHLKSLWQAAKITTEFVGYNKLSVADARVLAFVPDSSSPATSGWLALSPSPFYAVGGGQIGDFGTITVPSTNGGKPIVLTVIDTVRPYPNCSALRVQLAAGSDSSVDVRTLLTAGVSVAAAVDPTARHQSSVHHTSTHLLHAALARVVAARSTKKGGGLSTAIAQSGSLVSPARLRFDFTGPQLSADELRVVENAVNETALTGRSVQTAWMTLAAAKEAKAIAMFNEKYDANAVRVVSVTDQPNEPAAAAAGAITSSELCGGTHVQSVRDCFPFLILSEGSVSSGTRRIEAVAGRAAYDMLRSDRHHLSSLSTKLRVPTIEADVAVASLIDRVRKLEVELESERSRAALSSVRSFGSSIRVDGASASVPAHVHVFNAEASVKTLRDAAQHFIQTEKAAAAAKAVQPNSVHICLCTTSGRVVIDAATPTSNAKTAFAALVSAFGGGTGGGSSTRAQGTLPAANVLSRLAAVLPPLS